MRTLIQKTLTQNEEIYNDIQNVLKSANSEIKVVTAWFTDSDLLQTLIDKQKSGVKVDVIISENDENLKLSFDKLSKVGGKVVKVKSSGYGMMHQKFCVVDNEVAIHGSYNWTFNARKNNHESVIVTNHHETVMELVEQFNKLLGTPIENKKSFFSNLFRRITKSNGTIQEKKELIKEASSLSKVPTNLNDYQGILDAILTSEIHDFDRNSLREQGMERSKHSNGDSRMLGNSLDIVYAGLLDDITLGDQKINVVISKIQGVKTSGTAQLEKVAAQRKQAIERSFDADKEQKLSHIDRLEAAIKENKVKEVQTENSKKEKLDRKEGYKNDINSLKKEFVRKPLKYYELIPLLVMLTATVVYLFLFYSSAGYIMLYSTDDALLAELNGTMSANPEIYDFRALTKALDKGVSALLMVSLFFFIPLIFSYMTRLIKGTVTRIISFLSVAIIVDTFIALKVSQSIFNVRYLQGEVSGEWSITHTISDLNFYLVFILGLLGLLAFKLVNNRIMSTFDERNEDTARLQTVIEQNQILESINNLETEVNDLNKELANLNIEIINDEAAVKESERSVGGIEQVLQKELSFVDSQSIKDINTLERLCDISSSQVESGKLPYSVEVLKERVGVFFEGWNEFLTSYFAVQVAEDKSLESQLAKSTWLSDKAQSNSIKKVA